MIRVPTLLRGPDGPELGFLTVPARKHRTYHVVFIATTHDPQSLKSSAPSLLNIPCVRPVQTTPCAAEQRWAEERHRRERDGAAAASSAASPCCSASSRSSSTCVGTDGACGVVEGPVGGGSGTSSLCRGGRSRWCGCGRRAGASIVGVPRPPALLQRYFACVIVSFSNGVAI